MSLEQDLITYRRYQGLELPFVSAVRRSLLVERDLIDAEAKSLYIDNTLKETIKVERLLDLLDAAAKVEKELDALDTFEMLYVAEWQYEE